MYGLARAMGRLAVVVAGVVVVLAVVVGGVPIPGGEHDPHLQEDAHVVQPPPGHELSNRIKAMIGVSGGFTHGFIASFMVMIVSEIGDKTFFIAAIMAMRHNRLVVFGGAISALAVMTVLSTYVGQIATFIPRIYTHYASTILFFIFGLRMLWEGQGMADDEGAEELEEVAQELKKSDEERVTKPGRFGLSPVFLQAFTLTFLAEWGDRSQIATIILGARENALGVCVGGVLGHSVCTSMAVVGGKLIAEKVSVKHVTLVGGGVFLFFAFTNLFVDESSW